MQAPLVEHYVICRIEVLNGKKFHWLLEGKKISEVNILKLLNKDSYLAFVFFYWEVCVLPWSNDFL